MAKMNDYHQAFAEGAASISDTEKVRSRLTSVGCYGEAAAPQFKMLEFEQEDGQTYTWDAEECAVNVVWFYNAALNEDIPTVPEYSRAEDRE